MLLSDLTQGASNWIQSFLDPNRASAGSVSQRGKGTGSTQTNSTDPQDSADLLHYPEGFQPLRSDCAAFVQPTSCPVFRNPFVSPLLAPPGLLRGLPPVHLVVRKCVSVSRISLTGVLTTRLPAGLGSGRPAGRLRDVCQKAAGDGPTCEPDRGGGSSSRLPQPVPDLQGDPVRFGHLRGSDQRHLSAGRPKNRSSQKSLAGRDLVPNCVLVLIVDIRGNSVKTLYCTLNQLSHHVILKDHKETLLMFTCQINEPRSASGCFKFIFILFS